MYELFVNGLYFRTIPKYDPDELNRVCAELSKLGYKLLIKQA